MKVKFNILNLAKSDSLYNYGMKVLCMSEKEREEGKREWYRGGTDISYYQNNIRKEGYYCAKYFYTFTFTYTFDHADDSVYFAYS